MILKFNKIRNHTYSIAVFPSNHTLYCVDCGCSVKKQTCKYTYALYTLVIAYVHKHQHTNKITRNMGKKAPPPLPSQTCPSRRHTHTHNIWAALRKVYTFSRARDISRPQQRVCGEQHHSACAIYCMVVFLLLYIYVWCMYVYDVPIHACACVYIMSPPKHTVRIASRKHDNYALEWFLSHKFKPN